MGGMYEKELGARAMTGDLRRLYSQLSLKHQGSDDVAVVIQGERPRCE
jgi:hypothetical protein